MITRITIEIKYTEDFLVAQAFKEAIQKAWKDTCYMHRKESAWMRIGGSEEHFLGWRIDRYADLYMQALKQTKR